MSEQIRQDNHFFTEGDRVVLTENGYKLMSYRDVLIRTVAYRVIEVISKNLFTVRMITR